MGRLDELGRYTRLINVAGDECVKNKIRILVVVCSVRRQHRQNGSAD